MDFISPLQAGFDPAGLGEIETWFQRTYIDTGRLSGAVALVGHGDKVAYCHAFGTARTDARPMKPDAIFRVASMTKPIVSLAFMLLVERGLVALDTPVERIIPEFGNLGVYASGDGVDTPFVTTMPSRKMQMIDLLRHTSGLTYGLQTSHPVDAAYRASGLDDFYGTIDPAGCVAKLGQLPLVFSPGEAWRYSMATDVLGLVIERLSGVSLADFLTNEIFAPLGMSDTSFMVPPEKLSRLTDGFAFHPEQKRACSHTLCGRRALFNRGGLSSLLPPAAGRWRL
jgi:CubicO group peptidase (beta-lactamase class C family)